MKEYWLWLVPAICTFGVVICGLAVLVAATVHVIKTILFSSEDEQPKPSRIIREIEIPHIEIDEGPFCQHCGNEVGQAPIKRSLIQDNMDYQVRQCPNCKKETINSVEPDDPLQDHRSTGGKLP